MQTHCHGAEGLSHCCWTSDLITHPAHRSSSPSPIPELSPTHILLPLASAARRDPGRSSRPFPCLWACFALQITGTEGALEMFQCLESQTFHSIQIPRGNFWQTQSYPAPQYSDLGSGEGPRNLFASAPHTASPQASVWKPLIPQQIFIEHLLCPRYYSRLWGIPTIRQK